MNMLRDTIWEKSSHRDGGHCVEVTDRGAAGYVGMRDSKNAGHGPTLIFDRRAWRTFVGAL